MVGVAGLEPDSRATVHQCPTGASAPSACRAGPAVPRGSDTGEPSVLVDLEDGFEVGAAATTSSALADDVQRRGVRVVAPRGDDRVRRAGATARSRSSADPVAVPPGGTLTATAERLPSGSEAAFVVCRPDGEASADCGTPTPGRVRGSDGRASALRHRRRRPVPAGIDLRRGGGRRRRRTACLRAAAAHRPARGRLRRRTARAPVWCVAGAPARGSRWCSCAAPTGPRSDGDPFAGVEIPETPSPTSPIPEPRLVGPGHGRLRHDGGHGPDVSGRGRGVPHRDPGLAGGEPARRAGSTTASR